MFCGYTSAFARASFFHERIFFAETLGWCNRLLSGTIGMPPLVLLPRMAQPAAQAINNKLALLHRFSGNHGGDGGRGRLAMVARKPTGTNAQAVP
jgi:hypothetical protein